MVNIISMLVAVSLSAKVITQSSPDSHLRIGAIRTADGGYAMIGISTRDFSSATDILFIKMSPTLDVEWAKVWGGYSNDGGNSVSQLPDGGYLVGGNTVSFGAGGSDVLVMKVSSDGSTIEWARTIGGPSYEAGGAILTPDGGYIVVGWTESYSSRDAFAAKFSPGGELEWAKTFGAASYDEFSAGLTTADGGYLLGGSTYFLGPGGTLLVKLSSTGSVEWAKVIRTSPTARPTSMIQTSDGGYALTIFMSPQQYTPFDITLIKLSSSGNIEWAKMYGWVGEEDWPVSLIQTPDEGFLITGHTTTTVNYVARLDGIMLKLSSDGTLEWTSRFGGDLNEEFKRAFSLGDSTYLVFGGTNSFFGRLEKILFIKLGPNGGYPNCAYEDYPNSRDTLLSATSVTVGVDRTPTITPITQFPVNYTPNLSIMDVCEPLYENIGEENPVIPSMSWFPVPRGAVFVSSVALDLALYSPDGRLARRVRIEKGENRLSLEPGIYFWQAGNKRGKISVR